MEEEDNIIVKWAQEDVEMSYNLLNKYIYNIQYVDTIKIIKYLKVLQHVSDHR